MGVVVIICDSLCEYVVRGGDFFVYVCWKKIICRCM